MSTLRERVEGLAVKWRSATKAISTEGHERLLEWEGKDILRLCADELAAALAAEGQGDGLTQKLADSLRDYMRLASDNECVQFGVFGAAKDALAEFEAAAPSLHKEERNSRE